MNFSTLTSDDAVLAELGRRLRRHRLDRNWTQARLAREAGVSVPTVQRLEAGASVALSSLLGVLRQLELLDNLEALVPAAAPRPLELLERDGAQRQRATAESRAAPDDEPWSWAE